jgi:hypothetical protein
MAARREVGRSDPVTGGADATRIADLLGDRTLVRLAIPVHLGLLRPVTG